jgi:hypothetical protein
MRPCCAHWLPFWSAGSSSALRFVEGKLTGAIDGGVTDDDAIIHLPPLQLTPLVLGYRTAGELHASYPDVSVASPWRLLVDTLFPRVPSFIYTIY